MSKAASGRLKVFQAQFGFYDTVVAASSRAAALRAWGVAHDLFKTGLAKVADDPQARDAALAHPGIVLKRPVGSRDPYELDPGTLPEMPEGSHQGEHHRGTRSPAKPRLVREPADRRRLDEAEAALRGVEAQWRREDAELQRRQAELDSARAAAEAANAERRNHAAAAVDRARRMYRQAGGQD